MLTGNLERIVEHGKRADNIVKSMLAHSRSGGGDRQSVDLNALVEESLNLAYHGARAQDQNFNITLERDYGADIAPVELVPQDMTRVFLNLFGNGFYAANKRRRTLNDGAFRPALDRDHARSRQGRRGDGARQRRRHSRRHQGQAVPAVLHDQADRAKAPGSGCRSATRSSPNSTAGPSEVASEVGVFTEFIVTLPRSAHAQRDMRSSAASGES